jgi:hypothetical protein
MREDQRPELFFYAEDIFEARYPNQSAEFKNASV